MKHNMRISIIVAMAENGCIGKNNRMPWHISDDLKRFKSLTINHPVIMGRNTFESIMGYLKAPLPMRTNIVISKSGITSPLPETVLVFSDIDSAIDAAANIVQKEDAKSRDQEIFIIGGAQIYKQTIDKANRIYLTKIHKQVAGDAFFPDIDESKWREISREDHQDNDIGYSFITLERTSS